MIIMIKRNTFTSGYIIGNTYYDMLTHPVPTHISMEYVCFIVHFYSTKDEEIEDESISGTICKLLSEDFPQISPNELNQQILRCIGLLRTNSLDGLDGKGRILLPTCSFLSHSCVNNAKHVLAHDGNRLRLVLNCILLKRSSIYDVTHKLKVV